MNALVALRLCAAALVVGVVWQAPALDMTPRSTFSGCSPPLAGLVRHSGLPVTPTSAMTCSRATGDPDVPGVRVALRDRRPRTGEPCANLDFDRVAFTAGGGGVIARFAALGGLGQGTVQVPPDEVAMTDTETAYVVDAQLGTYEEVRRGNGRGLLCGVDPTFHFDCPTTHQMDRLCLVWFQATAAARHYGAGRETPGRQFGR